MMTTHHRAHHLRAVHFGGNWTEGSQPQSHYSKVDKMRKVFAAKLKEKGATSSKGQPC